MKIYVKYFMEKSDVEGNTVRYQTCLQILFPLKNYLIRKIKLYNHIVFLGTFYVVSFTKFKLK